MSAPSRLIRLAVILSVSVLASGCWDRHEIEQTAFVMQFGLDRHPEGGVIMSAQVAIPQLLAGGGGGGAGQTTDRPPFYVATARGETVQDAFAAAASVHNRRGIRSHVAAIVIGEDLGRDDVFDIADFIARDRELRLFMPVYVTEGDARSLLSIVVTQDRESWDFVRDLALHSARRGKTPHVRAHEMIMDLSQEGIDLLLPRLSMRSTAQEPVPMRGVGTAQSGVAEQNPNARPIGETLQASGAAVFRGGRMVGWMTERQVRGVMWLRDLGLHDPILSIEVDGKPVQAGLQVIHRSVTVKPEIVDGRVDRIAVNLMVEANVAEVMGNVQLFTRAGLRDLAERLKNEIKSEIEEAISAARLFQADVFGFGEIVRGSMPHRVWQHVEWRREFVRVPIDIQVEAEIRRTGRITDPLPLW